MTRKKLRNFLNGFVADSAYRDDEDIFELGIVTSMFAMDLVTFIEDDFGISIENEDLDLDNFRSVDAMTRLVESKLAAGTSEPAFAAGSFR